MIVNILLVVLTVLIIVQTYIDGKTPPHVKLVRPTPARAPSSRIRYEPPIRSTKRTITRFSRGKK